MNSSQLENGIAKIQDIVSKINTLSEQIVATEAQMDQAWSSDSVDKSSAKQKIRNDVNGIQSVNSQVSNLAQGIRTFKENYEKEAQRY